MIVTLIMQNNVDSMDENLDIFLDTGFFRCGRYGWDKEIAYTNGDVELVGIIQLETTYLKWILFRIWLFIYHPECCLLQMYRCNDTYIITTNE